MAYFTGFPWCFASSVLIDFMFVFTHVYVCAYINIYTYMCGYINYLSKYLSWISKMTKQLRYLLPIVMTYVRVSESAW